MRPRGSFGEVGRALLGAAEAGPGTACELAERAVVGYRAAVQTASRYVRSGHLVRLSGTRPAVLALPAQLAAENVAAAERAEVETTGNVFLLLARTWAGSAGE